MSMLLFFSFVIAMFVTMVLIPPLKAKALEMEFVDIPDERKVHSVPIPRIGGIAMVIGALLPVVMWARNSHEIVAFLLGAGVILAFGVWDDRKTLDYKIKFGGQILAVAIVVLWGGVRIHFAPFFSMDPIPEYIAIPLTFFALLGITNAINLADGLDGLAGGTTLISLAAICILAYMAGDYRIMLVALAIMGSIIGFLRFNTHPAQIFMGDGGSQFLGFSAGVLVIILTQQTNPTLSPAMPLLLLGLPIIDTFIVMGQRVLEGRSPFAPDKNHIHHKLLDLGFDHYEAVVVIYGLQTALVSAAFFFRYQTDLFNMALFAFVFVSAIFAFPVAVKTKLHLADRRGIGRASKTTQVIQGMRESGILYKYPYYFIAVTLPLFAAITILTAGDIPRDIVALSLVLAGLMAVLTLLFRNLTITFLERGLTYIAITFVAYCAYTRPESLQHTLPENIYFAMLVICVLFSFRFSNLRNVDITPLDFLVIILALTVPNVPGVTIPIEHFGVLVAKVFAMFYAAEVLINSRLTLPLWLRLGTTLVLSLTAVHGTSAVPI